MAELEGQIAVVTGVAGGIGAAIARGLVAAGAHVACVDIAPTNVESLRALAPSGQTIKGWICDVRNSGEIAAVCASIRGEFGDPTILINNVGGSGAAQVTDVEDTSDEVWDAIMALNVGSAFRFCRALVPAMKAARYGRIVNVSSTLMNGMFGAAGTVGARLPYVTAKSAIVGLTKQLAKDLGPFGIAVNAIAPGFTLPDEDARITKRFRALTPEQQRPMIADIPMQRPGTGEDMASAVRFLASPQNTYVSGQILSVDGGG
jgi:NAD(P)-dependent dehydrogenase (short-subunit alcohol dehydrogenase family)